MESIPPFQVPEVDGPTVFIEPQFRIVVPEDTTSLIVYIYDPEDPNRNDYDVALRYGEKVGFEEGKDSKGTVIYDWASAGHGAHEECRVFNEDLSPIQAGEYMKGEVKVILLNMGGSPFTVNRGMRIAQMVVVPAVQADIRIVDELPSTERGEGGFGHSGV